jgi:hypothetical protein
MRSTLKGSTYINIGLIAILVIMSVSTFKIVTSYISLS